MEAQRKPKLLVVDDEAEILEMIRNHFTLRGYEVLTAPDGGEGIETLERENPDIVLLDLKMKKMDGDKFLRGVRAKNLHPKVIVVTGYQDEKLQAEIERLGVDAFLEKPVSILELQKKVQELVGVVK